MSDILDIRINASPKIPAWSECILHSVQQERGIRHALLPDAEQAEASRPRLQPAQVKRNIKAPTILLALWTNKCVKAEY